MRQAILIFGILLSALAGAQTEPPKESPLRLMRRWVVFPFFSPGQIRTNADSAWWKVRERITNTKKYLVASKNFLNEKDVFYPRKKLSPDDVRLLSNLLDADVLVSGYSEGREFVLNAYLAQNGELFWSREIYFHASQRPGEQLEAIADKLMQELLAVVPYQGFTIIDPLITKAVYTEGNRKFAVVDVGVSDGLAEGNDVQWVQASVGTATPLLNDTHITVIAEGKVAKIRRGVIVAEILRAKSLDSIKEATLVRLPKQAEAMLQPYLKDAEKLGSVDSELLTPISADTEAKRRDTVVFGSVVSLLGVILLAL